MNSQLLIDPRWAVLALPPAVLLKLSPEQLRDLLEAIEAVL